MEGTLEESGLSRQEEQRSRLKKRKQANGEKLRAEVPEEQRLDVVCNKTIDLKLGHKVNHCKACWFLTTDCICEQLKAVKPSNNIRLIVWMHFREYFRASNTGKILLKAFPNSQLYLFGKSEDEEKFAKEITSSPYNCILFPSQDSIPLENFIQNVNYPLKRSTSTSETKSEEQQPLLTITVVDGTWGNAKTMMKHLNKIVKEPVVRVKINPVQKSNFSRTQTQPDRICTLEAAVMMLKELGESDDLCQSLLDSMENNIVALQVRSFKKPSSKKSKQRVNTPPSPKSDTTVQENKD